MKANAPITIALDFRTLDQLNFGNGQFRYCVDLIIGLAALPSGSRFLVIGSQLEPPDAIRHVFGDARWRYVPVRRWKFKGAAYLDYLRYAWLVSTERIDLLHSLHTFIPVLPRGRSVVTIYDLMKELFPEYRAAVASRPYRMFKHAIRTKSPSIIAISQTTADDLHRLWGIPTANITVVPLATQALEPSRPLPGAAIAALGNRPFVLSPFNLEARKNLPALLRAMVDVRRTHPDVRLVLYGKAAVTPERERGFESLVHELGLADAIDLTGFISDDERAYLCRHAAMFVFPSLYEGFGLPILEAMAAGACVVARNRSAMAEVLGDAGVQIETEDPASLAETVRSLLDDPARRESLGRAAEQRSARFTVDAMVRGTYGVYLKALDVEDVEAVEAVEAGSVSLQAPQSGRYQPAPLRQRGVSVVICCHNSSVNLPRTIEHLARQVVPTEIPWEVLVVDNASTDATEALASQLWPGGQRAPLRVIQEPQLGLSFARARGIAEARYEFITFVDDDNWLCPTWIQTVYEVMRDHPEVGALGGIIDPEFETSRPSWFGSVAYLYATGPAGEPSGDVTTTHMLCGAGLTVRYSGMMDLRAKGFRWISVDRKGTSLAAGGDTEMVYSLRLAGWRLWIDPRLRMKHFLPERRLRWEYARRLAYWSAYVTPERDALVYACKPPRHGLALRIRMWRESWIWQIGGALGRLLRKPAGIIKRAAGASDGDADVLQVEFLRGRFDGFLAARPWYDSRASEIRGVMAGLAGHAAETEWVIDRTA